MTTQLPRNPLNPASAAARAIDLIGASAVADAVDRSLSIVRDWADEGSPDKPNLAAPNMWQAMRIDEACLDHADEAPFVAFFERWKEHKAQTNEDPATAAARAAEAATGVVSEVLNSMAPGSENGTGWSKNEKARTLRKIADASEELDRVTRAVMRK